MRPRSATAEWKGNLQDGEGTMSAASGVLESAGYSFKTRFQDEPGSNPEELIAAAHAGCFSMAFANMLSEADHEPQSVRTTARVRMETGDEGPSIARSDLETEVSVEGIDDDEFQRIAEQAKEGCPVSRALGAIEIGMEARRA
jgi:osmotically inducible protein OsmC